MLKQLQSLNSHLAIQHVEDRSFSTFGRVLPRFPAAEAVDRLKETDIPAGGNVYIPSVDRWENDTFRQHIEKMYYGEMPIQIGYCNGNSSSLQGLEFHKGSEINVGATDFVLLLGSVLDIEEDRFHTKNIQAFYVPEATAVELFQTTLHLAPCKTTGAGFQCMVILPRGTNAPLEKTADDKLLFMKNKWLLSHPENKKFTAKGAHAGLEGPDLEIQWMEPSY
ncbi:DUF4867 family protein [Salibacterium aidingense]|uniref:DUF4867 family protein n=1 Tax=Salibacterium aidingense TaxID=384933 RepID=UPI00040233A6|nr:DUF4867 family protein [Salibacterium aidingense]